MTADDELRRALERIPRYAMIGDLNDRHMDIEPGGNYVQLRDVLAVLAATSPAEGLDVERLMTADANVADISEHFRWQREYWAEVAAQYAALAPEQPE